MKRFNLKTFHFLLCMLLVAGSVSAQQLRNGSSTIKRSSFSERGGVFIPAYTAHITVNSKNDLNVNFQAPFFKGAGLDRELVNLPYYEVEVKLNQNESLIISGIEAKKENETTAMFRQSVLEFDFPEGGFYPKSHVELGPRITKSKQDYQILKIYPIRVSRNGSQIEKASEVRYSLRKKIRNVTQLNAVNKTNSASNSVLDNGSWYKIGVTNEGIYKLDYSFLQSIGLNPSGIDPRNIRIYGNGGGMLPQRVGDFRHDDLAENSIQVVGEGDGTFNTGDYVLFYGASTHKWEYNLNFDMYFHQPNHYSDTTFYFLTVGSTQGKRVSVVASESGINYTPTSTLKALYHEQDLYNPLLSGRAWLGENFDFTTTKTFSFPLPNIAPGSEIQANVRVAARSNFAQNFTVRENNSTLTTLGCATVNTSQYGGPYYRMNYEILDIPSSQVGDGSLDLELTYSKPDASSVGWLDYIHVQYRQTLSVTGATGFIFSATANVGAGQVYGYNISNATSNHRIWDISDPVNVSVRDYSFSGGLLSFGVAAENVKRFIAFADYNTLTPVSARKLKKQNLHGLDQADYLMIVNPIFLEEANDLAAFHRSYVSGRTVHVVNIFDIYNEFSSGSQDPTAIRDFIKMFYDRAIAQPGTEPKYVLLFGDGTYDYKYNSTTPGTNFVPTYQSRKSQRPTESYTSDDYYGFLDDNEGIWGENARSEGTSLDIRWWMQGDTTIMTHGLDVAIGRFVCNNNAEARTLVDKVISYKDQTSFGTWRNRIVLVADHKDADGTTHVSQADSYTDDIFDANPCINLDKIYLDNYEMISTANGSRFPEGKYALENKLEEGSLIVNYTGHGGETGWSNSKILEIQDIQNLSNENRLPAYITATCEFGRFDDPERQAGAEKVFLQSGGGSIAMFTTVRVVYSGPNFVLNTNFYDYALSFDTVENRMLTLGEIFLRTKNASWLSGINNRNFTLLGDPGLTLNYPHYRIAISEINGTPATEGIIDTLKSLSLVTIKGEVQDENGVKVSAYNGDLFMTVFDKPSTFNTKRKKFSFQWQKNKVFNGAGTITNGEFSFQFVVPVDISYEEGLGKVSLYCSNQVVDGAGCDGEIYIGGTGGIIDNTGPLVEVFMNDEKFAEGGMVGSDPTLVVSVFDENGINTVGTGIGHELTAILDNADNSVILLNDYYAADKNSYQEGRIEYPFSKLALGEHRVEVKIWDVANNSAEAFTTFIVADDGEMALGHVLNYPNPFTSNTKFYIEHNQNGRLMDCSVKIYTVSGRMVKSLYETFFADGNLYCDMEWDGLDDYGDALGRGVYVYKVTLRDSDSGESVSTFEKLVVLR